MKATYQTAERGERGVNGELMVHKGRMSICTITKKKNERGEGYRANAQIGEG